MPVLPGSPDQNDPVMVVQGEMFKSGMTLFIRDHSGRLFNVLSLLRRYTDKRIRLVVFYLGGPP